MLAMGLITVDSLQLFMLKEVDDGNAGGVEYVEILYNGDHLVKGQVV